LRPSGTCGWKKGIEKRERPVLYFSIEYFVFVRLMLIGKKEIEKREIS
jgi:hypothetical protein